MSVLDRFFIPRTAVQTKVTEFHNLRGETAHVLTTYITVYWISTSYQKIIIAFFWE
jgi:hypothetical protein